MKHFMNCKKNCFIKYYVILQGLDIFRIFRSGEGFRQSEEETRLVHNNPAYMGSTNYTQKYVIKDKGQSEKLQVGYRTLCPVEVSKEAFASNIFMGFSAHQI